MTEPHRFGVVALSGPPNAGKSTLLNRIVGEKVSITSRRAQTTRHRILGIKTLPRAQLVLVDTPGLNRDRPKRLNRATHRTALRSLADVDLILFMIDIRGWTPELERLFAQVAQQGAATPIVLAINKIDRLSDRRRLLPLIKRSAEIHPFAEIMPLSALKMKAGEVDEFLAVIIKHLPPGPPGFPADQRSDRSQRFLASELVREQTCKLLGNELPHASAVEVTRFEYDGDLLRVVAVIWVERASQKPIVIGQGGRQLKAIGERARKQMERMFGAQVYLDLWVKVRKNWSDNAAMLRAFGYLED
ncbi:MAG: GTPase Era [bacterium]